MIKSIIGAIGSVLLLFALAACAGSSDEGNGEGDVTTGTSGGVDTVDPVPTVTINGVELTCGDVIGANGCGPETQAAFNEYKENLISFLNSGQLGPLNNTDLVTDAVFAGLVACVYQPDQNGYIDEVLQDEAFAGWERAELLPVWFEAQYTLCLSSGGEGYTTGDYITP